MSQASNLVTVSVKYVCCKGFTSVVFNVPYHVIFFDKKAFMHFWSNTL